MKINVWHCLACILMAMLQQLPSNAQEIKIGQKCPDLTLSTMADNGSRQIRLSDYRGKLLIIDFWGLGCSACVQAFPKIDSLQARFRGQVQFIAVNSESPERTTRFFQKRTFIKKPSIPFVAGDSILSKMFPHTFVPHHVWIDKDGIVQYITDGYNATAEHINEFIIGNHLILHEKKYDSNYVYEGILQAVSNKKGIENLESYSILMHCQPIITVGNSQAGPAGITNAYHIVQNCASIAQLYAIAFGENGKYDFNHANTLVLEVKNKSKYLVPTDNNARDTWGANYSFNYELMVPASESDEIYKKMQQDLARYFKVEGRVEKRNIPCLALVRTGPTDNLKTKGLKAAGNFWVQTNDSLKFMLNQDFRQFVTALSAAYEQTGDPRPFVDMTKYNGRIDIRLSVDVFDHFDIEGLNKQLHKYGLALVQKNVSREVLVLREPGLKIKNSKL